MISLKDSSQVSPDQLNSFSDSFSHRLLQLYPKHINGIVDKVNDSLYPQLIQLVLNHIPLFLEPADYAPFDSLQEPAGIKAKLQTDLHAISSPAGFALRSVITKDPLGFSNTAFKK